MPKDNKINKKISIIIATKGRRSRLAIVLKALDSQVDDETEVVVVFDGYCEAAMESYNKIKLGYKPITVVLETNSGRSVARNRGIEKSSGDLLLFIDDDRVPSPNFVKKHREAHQTKCVVIGGRKEIRIPEDELERISKEDVPGDGYNELFAKARFENGDIFVQRKYFILPFYSLRCLGFTTGNVSVEREDIERSGLFNENFKGWGYEDTELGYRLSKSKIKFIRKSFILNYHLLHNYELNKRFKDEFRNHLYFFRLIKNNIILKTVVFFSFLQLLGRFIFWSIHSRTMGKK